MSVSNEIIRELRRQRGWSQEQLATISGLSERTVQRIETDGKCSLDSKMALASAFEVPPSALDPKATSSEISAEFVTDWPGAFGLFICGLLAPIVVALTATNAAWDIATFALVIGLTVVLALMSYGGKATWLFFDRTSWIVRHPVHAHGLNELIVQARGIIRSAYMVGLIASCVTGFAILIYASESEHSLKTLMPIVIKPLIYSVLFSEFWIRPFKMKLQRMLGRQTPLAGAPTNSAEG